MGLRISTLVSTTAALSLTVGAVLARAQTNGWELRHDTPGAPSCRAVKLGASVDIQLLRTRTNQLVLAAGHPDWSYEGDPFPITLAIDGGAPVTLTAFPLGRVVFIRIDDDTVRQRLMAARTLDVSLHGQHFQADVAGLRAAFDAITVCPG